jgi:hypothetical protein
MVRTPKVTQADDYFKTLKKDEKYKSKILLRTPATNKQHFIYTSNRSQVERVDEAMKRNSSCDSLSFSKGMGIPIDFYRK